MFKKQKWKTSFIDINFAPSRKRKLFPFKAAVSFYKKDLILYSISAATFTAIFITPYIADNLIQKQQKKLYDIKRQINHLNIQIKTIQAQLLAVDNKFKNFYIPKLKEKVFIYWYKLWFYKKVLPTIKEFQTLIKGSIPYMGVWVYPNSSLFGKSIIEEKSLPKKIIEYQKINTNIFSNPSNLKYMILPNIFLRVELPKIDSYFTKLLSKVKNKNIKANLLLEYVLLKHPLQNFSYSSVAVLIFPINLVETGKSKSILNYLNNFCNAVLLNKEAYKKLFLNNKWQISKVLEGVCIKYAF